MAASETASRPKRARNWDALAAVVAALIGFLALLVSGYTAWVQRQQVRAQVWPWLVAGNDDLDQSLVVYNKGVGPAIVRSAQVFADGRPQPDWDHVLRALGLPERGFLQSTINPNVLTPGEQLKAIKFPDVERWQAFRAAATGRVRISICFCSSLDECWIYDDRHLVGFKASSQLVHAVDRCPTLADDQTFNN